jgi:hypothetical protein
MKAPCAQCPFRKDSEPVALGGSAPEVYIGQSIGSYLLPCHMGYEKSIFWRMRVVETPQCAGAAIYRTNNGVGNLPGQLLLLPPSDEVFGSHAEFLAHHKQIPLTQAAAELAAKPPREHLRDQLKRTSNMHWTVPKKESA